MPTAIHRPFTLYILFFLLLVLSLGGFFGAYYLLTDPSGVSIGFPPDMLTKLPIPDYTLPGLFLLVVYAIGSLVVIYALWKRATLAWLVTLALGVLLVGWVLGEVVLFQMVAGIMVMTGLLGILIVLFTVIPPTYRYYNTQ